MASAPKTLNHPTFGPCKLVPSIVAIKWATPRDTQATNRTLSAYSLTLATDAPGARQDASGAKRDPRPVNVNQSETLAWVSGARVSENLLSRVNADENVEWVAPL